MNILNFLRDYVKMPLRYPPSIRRKRLVYSASKTRGGRTRFGRGSVVGRLMRSIGAPAMVHTFARPGTRLQIFNDSAQWFCNGAPVASSNTGLSQGGGGTGKITSTLDTGFSQYFQFSYLTTPTDLAGLYDNYRIKMVKLRFDLSYNAAPGTGVTGVSLNAMPMMHYAVDPDDATVPTSIGDILQYSKSRSLRLGDRPVTISLVPRANGVVSTTNVAAPGTALTPAVGSMMPYNTWLDCQNSQTTPHYGLKMWFENMPVGLPGGASVQQNCVLTITPVYILECKNVH